MKINKQEKEFKHALALQKESNKLWRIKYNTPSIKLAVPIQHGYVRILELKPEIKERHDYEKIKSAFEMCGYTKAFHKNKDFLNKHKKGILEAHAKLGTVRDPRFSCYYKESQREEELKKIEDHSKYLRHCSSIYVCNCKKEPDYFGVYKFTPHYSFDFPEFIQEITKKHILTHYTPLDGTIESRLKEIDNEMNYNNYYKLLGPTYGRWGRSESVHEIRERIDLKYELNRIYHGEEGI